MEAYECDGGSRAVKRKPFRRTACGVLTTERNTGLSFHPAGSRPMSAIVDGDQSSLDVALVFVFFPAHPSSNHPLASSSALGNISKSPPACFLSNLCGGPRLQTFIILGQVGASFIIALSPAFGAFVVGCLNDIRCATVSVCEAAQYVTIPIACQSALPRTVSQTFARFFPNSK